MNIPAERHVLFDKAVESLAGAESELANGRYNNCANRCYYSCLQAAIVALLEAGIRPPGGRIEWSHAFVQSQFVEQLIDRRKVYPASMRDLLSRTILLRQTADYRAEHITQIQASRAVRRTREFLEAIQAKGGGAR
ncbi:MAG: HEPN domain-containing protein [Chloroflexi bacterium]|nr:HEPN domain-containing protein [Chloroflexota bacterium]